MAETRSSPPTLKFAHVPTVVLYLSSLAVPPYRFDPGVREPTPGRGKQEPGSAGAPGASGATEAKHFVVAVGAANAEPPVGAAPAHDFLIVPAFNLNELIELIKGA